MPQGLIKRERLKIPKHRQTKKSDQQNTAKTKYMQGTTRQ